MTVNEAPWDRALRVALGAVLMVLGFGVMGGVAGVVVGLLGLVPLLTGLLGWCPLYSVFGVCTNRAHGAR